RRARTVVLPATVLAPATTEIKPGEFTIRIGMVRDQLHLQGYPAVGTRRDVAPETGAARPPSEPCPGTIVGRMRPRRGIDDRMFPLAQELAAIPCRPLAVAVL